MPVATVFMGGFALNNNPAGSAGPNRFLPLMGVGLLPLLIMLLMGG